MDQVHTGDRVLSGLKKINDLVGGNPEKVKEIINQFIAKTPGLLSLLRKKTDQKQ